MIFSGIKPVFPPQMLDELIFVPEVVWTYLWQINFFFPEILKVRVGTGLLKSKKKNCDWRRKKKCSVRLLRRNISSWTVHGLSNLFMNCSWTCSNCCCEYLDISRLLNIFWTCSWTVHEHVQKKKIIWIEDPDYDHVSKIFQGEGINKSANTDAACALAALFDAHKLAAGYSAERKLRLLDAPEHAHALKKAATAAAPPTHATKRD